MHNRFSNTSAFYTDELHTNNFPDTGLVEPCAAEFQEIIYNLLFIGLDDIPLESKLDYSLRCVSSASWMHKSAQLTLFMIEEQSGSVTLKSQYNMQKTTRVRCLDPVYRNALCYTAAKTGRSSFNSGNMTCCNDNKSQSNHLPFYSIPVSLNKKVIAVLVLYLEADHKQDIRELCYLRAVCNVITYLIKLYHTEQKMHRLANYDALTSLPNKNLFQQYTKDLIDDTKVNGRKFAILFMNLDGLKRINDSMGHKNGYKVLRIMAKRLRRYARGAEFISRWGGGEFIIILPDICQAGNITTVIQDIFEQLREPVSLVRKKRLVINASIGVSIFPDDGKDSMSLVQHAAIAMHEAKKEGGNCHHFYNSAMNTAVTERLGIETGLSKALIQKQFELYYQPLLNNNDQIISGAEALIRWNHPKRGVIQPDRFIPVAEASGLILNIGEWVLLEACSQCQQWQNLGYKDIGISVNLSAVQFRDSNIFNTVKRALEHTGLHPSLLTLELTESTIIENVEQAIESLHKLKAIGVALSVDDFGTGYSSLSFLKRFPIDKLKIDRSFVRDADSNIDDKSIVRSIIALGHNLKLGIIAEGVEKIEHMYLLNSLDCEESQGYYISRPLPADDFLDFIHNWQKNQGFASNAAS